MKSCPLARLAAAPERAFVYLTLARDSGETGSEVFLTEPKRCEIARSRVTVGCSPAGKGFSIRLTADKPAFYVSLFAAGIQGEFSDNCFTLVPGAPMTVTFQPRSPVTLEGFRKTLSVTHLRNTY